MGDILEYAALRVLGPTTRTTVGVSFPTSALKYVYKPPTSGSSPMLSSDSLTLITNKNKNLKRWA